VVIENGEMKEWSLRNVKLRMENGSYDRLSFTEWGV